MRNINDANGLDDTPDGNVGVERDRIARHAAAFSPTGNNHRAIGFDARKTLILRGFEQPDSRAKSASPSTQIVDWR
jgi:hypothetical protein